MRRVWIVVSLCASSFVTEISKAMNQMRSAGMSTFHCLNGPEIGPTREVAFTSSGRKNMFGTGLSFARERTRPSCLCLMSWPS